MSLPFTFSVSDFLTVGKLIGKVAVELRKVCMYMYRGEYLP